MIRSFHLMSVLIVSMSTWLLNCAAASEPLARPTFHCIGLYWKPSDGAADNPCAVWYRPEGTEEWKEALPLWFDYNWHPDLEALSDQYRGSIVNLLPATRYDIRLTLGNTGTEAGLSAMTWSEQFPVKSFVALDGGVYDSALHITEGGSTEEGYIVYGPPEGKAAVFDVGNEMDFCVRVDASYVILRGLTCKGARRHGILLGGVSDVVIEQCDVSGWGRTRSNGFGVNLDSAVYSESGSLERIVIQRCRLHHPRSNANAWAEGGHPEGPQAVCFRRSKGWHVIRYNEMYSDEEHCFNDIMGEERNVSCVGFPNRDTDIYGNLFANCRDDGIESEGANMNVRIWSNQIDAFYMAIGAATTSLGPQYIWRNVSGFSRRGPISTNKYDRGGAFLKLGGSNPQYAQGAIYVLHNTILQPPAPWESPKHEFAGCETGLNITGRYGVQNNILGRNNILHVNNYNQGQESIKDTSRDPRNSFDFDLYNGFAVAVAGSEQNGISLAPDQGPQYDPNNSPGQYALAAGAPGYDMAERIANFNDQFTGLGPDIGACEYGAPALPIGIDADWTAWLAQWEQGATQDDVHLGSEERSGASNQTVNSHR